MQETNPEGDRFIEAYASPDPQIKISNAGPYLVLSFGMTARYCALVDKSISVKASLDNGSCDKFYLGTFYVRIDFVMRTAKINCVTLN
jgi:hypothetical protein